MTNTTGLYGQTSLPWDSANPARRRHLLLVPAPADTEPTPADTWVTTADTEAVPAAR